MIYGTLHPQHDDVNHEHAGILLACTVSAQSSPLSRHTAKIVSLVSTVLTGTTNDSEAFLFFPDAAGLPQ